MKRRKEERGSKMFNSVETWEKEKEGSCNKREEITKGKSIKGEKRR